MVRILRALLLGVLSAFLWAHSSGHASAEKRVALVIGNSAYTRVGRLPNTANDANAVANLLKSSGFDVVDARKDLSVNEMKRAIREFTIKVRDADIGLVFYAGHGIEVDGTNYLLPTDAVLEQDIDIEDEAIALDRIIRTLDPVKRLRLVILDACRDNPFTKTMKRTVASRSVGRGLAKIEPTSSDTLIAFAAKAGSTASDGDGSNSPFTTALVKTIAIPGLDVRLAFGKIRDEVLASTSGKQEPFVYGSLGGSTVSLVPPPAPAPVIAAPATTEKPVNDIRKDYEIAAQIATKEAWGYFLGTYPSGFYSNMARAALAKIAAEEARLAAAVKAAETKAAEAKAAEAKAAAEARATAAARRTADAEAKLAVEAKAVEVKAAAAAKAAADKAAVDAKAAEPKTAAEKAIVVASAPATAPEPKAIGPDAISSAQSELRRVGCYIGSPSGNWDKGSQSALELFNKHAGLKLDVKIVSLDTLSVLKGKNTRVCPLHCDRGYRPDGESCVKIVCKSGQVLNDAGECAANKKAKSARSEPSETAKSSTGGGELYCDRGGCRPAPKNCRVGYGNAQFGSGGGQTLECK